MSYQYSTQGYEVTDAGKRIVVDPITRIEGHLRCEVNINSSGIFPPQIFEWIGNKLNVRYQQYCNELDVKQAIALAYRSGYLRAKKGRPFKIGGEKD